MKAIVGGTILAGGSEIHGKALVFDRSVRGIAGEADLPGGCERIEARNLYIAPGLIDLHIHGYLGADVSDGREEGLRSMAEALIKNGVTGFLPTTMTLSWPETEKAFKTVRGFRAESQKDSFLGSLVLGVHAEGPYINTLYKGAQSEAGILPPDAEKLLAYKDIIRIVTIAPEMPGGISFIRKIRESSDIIVSIGHSGADFEKAMEAISVGVTYVTHLFNAMSGLHHRNPGVVGAALTTEVFTEVIADSLHVHPGLFRLLARIKGDRLILVTDCNRASGLGDGEYTLGGQKFNVRGIECRLADGTIAGSVLKLNQAVRNLRDEGGISMAQAVAHASLYAANAIGLSSKGELEEGRDADIVLFDWEMNAHMCYIGGIRKI
jgi:N-acetylglucosamine-6-phosphate deacetylase